MYFLSRSPEVDRTLGTALQEWCPQYACGFEECTLCAFSASFIFVHITLSWSPTETPRAGVWRDQGGTRLPFRVGPAKCPPCQGDPEAHGPVPGGSAASRPKSLRCVDLPKCICSAGAGRGPTSWPLCTPWCADHRGVAPPSSW